MVTYHYYYLRLLNTPSNPQWHALQEKDGAYLSPHGRLANWRNAAAIRTEPAAVLIRDLWMEALQERWGQQLRIELEPATLTARQVATTGASHGAATLLARARAKRFVSNQTVDAAAIAAAHLELSEL